jgi:hypothetical protein
VSPVQGRKTHHFGGVLLPPALYGRREKDYLINFMDVFHSAYRELNEDEKAHINSIKNFAQELYNLYPQTEDGRGKSREISLAMTALEESVMWAVKGLTK